MLTKSKDAVKRASSATPSLPASKVAGDLEFVAANQQLEGFSGNISARVANHEPDLNKIAKAAKDSGAQIPNPRNSARTPIFHD